MTMPQLSTTTHLPTLMCGCPACVAAYLAALAESGNTAAYNAAVATMGAGALTATTTVTTPPPPTATAMSVAASATLVSPPTPVVQGTYVAGSFMPSTLGTSIGTLTFAASSGTYGNASYLPGYDGYAEIDFNNTTNTTGTFYATVTLTAGETYNFDLSYYNYSYYSTNNFAPYIDFYNGSGTLQTGTASGTGAGAFGISFTATTSGTYYIQVGNSGNSLDFYGLLDVRAAESSPLPAATYTATMPDGLSNATYVQAILAGGDYWWHTIGGSTVPTATDGLMGARHTLTYSFLTSDVSGDTTGGFAAMGANEQAAVQAALTYISSLYDITFTQVASGQGMINYGSNNQGSVSAGYSNYANTGGVANVMISNDATYGYTNSSSYALGTYAWEVLIHETGHALGLKHPGNYNAGGGGTVAPYLPTDMDNRQYSVMSYNNAADVYTIQDTGGGNFSVNPLIAPSYQLLDFYALQYLYGANTTTTTLVNQDFTWAANTPIYQTLYAIGSGNMIDLSNQTLPSVVNLNDGTFSSIDELLNTTDISTVDLPADVPYSFLQANYPSFAAELYNGINDLAIAPNAQIDTLKLGGGTATVTANNDGDAIYLGSGTDTITGGSGNDTFYLGTGSATINGMGGTNVLHVNATEASYGISYSNGTTTLTKGGITDTLTNIASIVFTNATYTPGGTVATPETITAGTTTLSSLEASIAASSLFSVVDNNGVATSALTYTIDDTGSAGYFVVNGTIQANNTPISLNATTLAETTYVATLGGGTDSITLTVNDGTSTATATFSIVSPGLSIIGHTVNQSLRAQTYSSLSALFTVTDTHGPVTSYQIEDENTALGQGYFLLNGVQQVQGSYFTVTAAQFSTLTYVSPLAGTDMILVKAIDGSYSVTGMVFVQGPASAAPGLTVTSTTLTRGAQSTVAMSSLITGTENNGLPAADLTYTLTDSGTSGYFLVNGVNDGETVTVSAANLALTTYVSTVSTGTDTISVTVTDTLATSATKTLTIQTTPAAAPVLTLAAITTAANGATFSSFASNISETDANGVSASGITYYITYSGTGGSLYYNGTLETAGTQFQVTGTTLSELSFIPGLAGGTTTLSIAAGDGYATSAASTLTITSPNTPGPVVTVVPANATLTTGLSGGTYSLSQLFTYADANPNATAFDYEFEDVAANGSTGYFKLGSTIEADGSVFYVPAAQLSQLSYIIGSGTQTLYMRGNDGTNDTSNAHFGAWVALTATVPTAAAPVLTLSSITTAANGASYSSFASNISETDANGVSASGITYYITYSGTGGSLYYNGTLETAGTQFQVTGTTLSELSFIPGLAGGTTTLSIAAGDGYATSAASTLTITSPNTPGPVVTVVPANATLTTGLSGGTYSLSQLFTYADANPNATAFDYEFEDVAANGSTGYFKLGSTIEADGSVFYVPAAQLSQLSYIIGSGTQTLYMRGNDGTNDTSNAHFGAWVALTATVPTATAPVLTLSSITTAANGASYSSFASNISETDANGVSASGITYYITYSGTGGSLYYNGTLETAGTQFQVTGTTLSELSFIPGLAGGTTTLSIAAGDGYATSTASTLTITSPNTPGPVVTVVPANGTFTTGLSGGTYSLSQLFTYADANPNATAFDYEFEDVAANGSTGYFKLSSTAEANGSLFYIPAAQLGLLSYFIGSGTQTLYMRGNDGTNDTSNAHWGAWVAVTTKVPTAQPPTLTAQSTTLNSVTSGFASAASIVATDLNGVSLSNLTYTLTYSGSGGSLLLSGSTEAEGSALTLTASQLAALSYNPSLFGGTDTFTLTVNDGYATSAPVTFTVASAAAAGPVFTATNTSITTTRDEIFSTSTASNPLTLFTETDSVAGATLSQYEFFVDDTAGGVGSILINGVAQFNDTTLLVNAADLTTASFQSVSGTETLYIRANDGTASNPHWGAWTAETVTAPAPLPGAAFTPVSATISPSRDAVVSNALSLWTETDSANAPISQYEFFGGSSSSEIGGFSVSGALQANGQIILVSAANVGTVSYQSYAGTQVIYVRANDGTLADPNWGNWSAITVTAPAVTVAPVFTPVNATISMTRDQINTNPIGLWTETDPAGGTISQYQVFDDDTAGGVGNFLYNGAPLLNDTTQTITASQIGSLTYQAVSGSQTIYVRANDGTAANPIWGNWSAITVTAPAPLPGAVFTPVSSIISPSRGSVVSNALSLWGETDSANAPISQYEFFGGSSSSEIGGFSVSGVAQANGQIILVSAANVGTVSYQTYAGTQMIYVRANDGTVADPNWGNWSAVTVNAPAVTTAAVFTPVSAAITMTRDQINTNPIGLWTEADASGGTISQYQFFDDDTAGGVGSFLFSGTALLNDTTQTINASQLSSLSYQAVSGTETIYVRANDGTSANPIWGAWSAITVTAPPALPAATFTAVSASINMTRDQVNTNPLSLWTETDSTGAAISQYQFFDSDITGGLGNFLLSGTALLNDTTQTVNASQLSSLTYQAVSGMQTIYVRANDGTASDPNWGNWTAITVNAPAATVGVAFTPVNAIITPTTRAQSYTNLASTLWTPADTTGGTIAQYQVFDDDTAGGLGNFYLGSQALANDFTQTITAGQLSTLSYVSVAGKQTIYIRANDGTTANAVWGAWDAITVNAAAPLSFAPVKATLTATANQTYTPLALWTETDPLSGTTISQYQFFDNDTTIGTGNFYVGSTAQANDTTLTIAPGSLGTFSYKIASGTEIIYIRGNDGTTTNPDWSAWSPITVTVPSAGSPVAPVVTHVVPNLSSAAFAPVPVSNSVVSPASLLVSSSASVSPTLVVHHL